MAQHDYDIANQSGANFRADLNNALDAIVSNNSGSSEPSTTFAYEWWIDTSANVLKLRNSANNAWITLPLSITADNSTSGALTVNGNLSTTGTLDVNGGEVILDADADTSITADTDDQIDFKIGAVDVATLTNSHLVLKGTTPKITIGDGGAEDTSLIFDGNAQDYYLGLDDTDDVLKIGKGSTVGTTPALSIDENLLSTFAGGVTIQGAFTSPGIDDNADAVAITINSSEQVGINTTSPNTALHTASGSNSSGLIDIARFQNVGTSLHDGARIQLTAGTSTSGAGIGCIGVALNSAHLVFHSGGNNERARIDSSGRTLINITTNPAVGGVSSGHFTEAISATNWVQAFRNSQSTPFGISIKYTATPNDTGKAFFYCEDGAPAARFEVMSNGGLKNYSGNNVNLSDEREKKNIVDADNQLENIKNLLIKSFHYNEDDDSADKRLGVIAQEVETNLPHLVEQYSNIGGEERKGVKEQQLMWMAIKAIQELEARVQALED